MIGRLGPTELLLILASVLLLFGCKKLPDMARSLGKSARNFKAEAEAMKPAQVEGVPLLEMDFRQPTL